MNLIQTIIEDLKFDMHRQMESKLKYCLLNNGFDILVDDFERVKVIQVIGEDVKRLVLDGVIIATFTDFAFQNVGLGIIGGFEFNEA